MSSPLKGPGFKLDFGSINRSLPPPLVSSTPAGEPQSPQKTHSAGTAALEITVSETAKAVNPKPVSRAKIPPSLSLPPRPTHFENIPSQIRQEVDGEKILTTLMEDPSVKSSRISQKTSSSSPHLEKLIQLARTGKSDSEFQECLKKLPPDEAPKIIKKMLKELAFEEKGKEYTFMLKNLRVVFPQIDTYITHVIVDKFEGDLLSPEGIRSMITSLQEKGSLKMPCVVCESHEQFQEELKKLTENSADIRMGFIVKNQTKDSKERNLHVTPIYIEKKGNSFSVAITDSLGNNALYTAVLSAKIDKQLTETKKEVQIYCYADVSRQGMSDKTNCPIFCIRDLVQFSKFHKPMAYLEEATKPEKFPPDQQSKNSRIQYFSKLPPSMMKLTQSIKKIKGYDKDSQLYKSMRAKHERMGLNLMVEQRFLKYERLLIAQVISEALKK